MRGEGTLGRGCAEESDDGGRTCTRERQSFPFRPINPRSAFNLRVFASYSLPPRLTSSLSGQHVEEGYVTMDTPGVICPVTPNRRSLPRPHLPHCTVLFVDFLYSLPPRVHIPRAEDNAN